VTPSSFAIRSASSLGLGPPAGGQAGRGGDHLAADAVPLDRLHHRVHAPCRCGERAASTASLAVEADRIPPAMISRSSARGPPAVSAADLADPDALSRSQAAADRLEHPAGQEPSANVLGLGDGAHRREPRAGDAQPGQPPRAMASLSWVKRSAAPSGPDRHAVLLQRGQVRAWDVLVVEGEHVHSRPRKPRRSASERKSPSRVPATTWAALSLPGSPASTRKPMPRNRWRPGSSSGRAGRRRPCPTTGGACEPRPSASAESVTVRTLRDRRPG